MDQMKLSVVIPLYNDAGIVEECLRSVRAALEGIPRAECAGWEIVFVDDGSRDRSAELIRAQGALDPRFELVELSRNFGFQSALAAGLAHAGASVAGGATAAYRAGGVAGVAEAAASAAVSPLLRLPCECAHPA